MAHTLRAAGFAVEGVDGSEAALRWIREVTPDLILLDLIMPEPDGYALLGALRSDARTRQVPILVITSVGSDEDVARAFELGADDLVNKPFRPVELIARIRSQLRIRGYVEALGRKEHDAKLVLELTQALCSSLDFRGVLFTVVRKIVALANVARCSIVLVRERSGRGYVIAQSDDESLRDVPSTSARSPRSAR